VIDRNLHIFSNVTSLTLVDNFVVSKWYSTWSV